MEPTLPLSPALADLSLSRSATSRAAHHRDDPDLLARLWADPATRVLRLAGSRAPVAGPVGSRSLRLVSPADLSLPTDLWLYLGTEEVDGSVVHHLAVVGPRIDDADVETDGDWEGLRELGSELGDRDAGLFTQAVALANWHASHPRCARCGAATVVRSGGYVRHCPQDGSDHHPRTDPAVIMAIVDADDRLLLGRQAVWPPGRFSTLAGYVEPGESLEAAVRREVLEEAGVRVGEVLYRGNQPWPFPASLMLGFVGRALDSTIEVDGVEIEQARWFTRAELLAAVTAGELRLPPDVSIARRLIEDWYGDSLLDSGVWR